MDYKQGDFLFFDNGRSLTAYLFEDIDRDSVVLSYEVKGYNGKAVLFKYITTRDAVDYLLFSQKNCFMVISC